MRMGKKTLWRQFWKDLAIIRNEQKQTSGWGASPHDQHATSLRAVAEFCGRLHRIRDVRARQERRGCAAEATPVPRNGRAFQAGELGRRHSRRRAAAVT